jgi:mannose-6-phosphate isomerase-like protein (cupin superfamily)
MAAPYTRVKLDDVKDSAPDFGLGEDQQSRFATEAVGSEDIGVSHHRFSPGVRQAFGHRHDEPEEVYVVLSGSGRIKLGDEILDIERLDAIRVQAEVIRAFEAGPDGLEVLAFGPHHRGDGEVIQGWWSD